MRHEQEIMRVWDEEHKTEHRHERMEVEIDW